MRKNVKKKPAAQTSAPGTVRRPLYWISLVCISSIWMFIFGVLVGRGTAPISMDIKKLQKELAGITRTIAEKEEADLKEYAQRIDNKTELEFYESLKEEEIDAVKPGIQPSENAIPVKKSLAMATKARMLHKKALANPAAPEPEPEDKALENLKYRWTIQVSSVKNGDAADRMVSDLKKQGHPAYKVMAKTADNGIFYRVRVGPYKDKSQASQKMTVLKQHDYDAILISM